MLVVGTLCPSRPLRLSRSRIVRYRPSPSRIDRSLAMAIISLQRSSEPAGYPFGGALGGVRRWHQFASGEKRRRGQVAEKGAGLTRRGAAYCASLLTDRSKWIGAVSKSPKGKVYNLMVDRSEGHYWRTWLRRACSSAISCMSMSLPLAAGSGGSICSSSGRRRRTSATMQGK